VLRLLLNVVDLQPVPLRHEIGDTPFSFERANDGFPPTRPVVGAAVDVGLGAGSAVPDAKAECRLWFRKETIAGIRATGEARRKQAFADQFSVPTFVIHAGDRHISMDAAALTRVSMLLIPLDSHQIS